MTTRVLAVTIVEGTIVRNPVNNTTCNYIISLLNVDAPHKVLARSLVEVRQAYICDRSWLNANLLCLINGILRIAGCLCPVLHNKIHTSTDTVCCCLRDITLCITITSNILSASQQLDSMINIGLYLCIYLLDSSTWSTICSCFVRIGICDDWYTWLTLVTLVSKLIKLGKIQIHISTGSKTLCIEELTLIVCRITSCV